MDLDQDFNNQLLAALEDELIKNRILEIATLGINTEQIQPPLLSQNENEVRNLQQKNEQYVSKIQQLEKELLELKAAYDLLEINFKEKHQELQEQYNYMVKENEELQGNFKNARQCYDIYLKLPMSVKTSLKGIFKGSSIEEFVYCGVQNSNLESLWEFIKLSLIEEKELNIEELISIFQYFFHAFSKIYDNPIFVLDDTKEGQQFDHEIHIRTTSSKVIGPITKVLLPGYRNIKTNKIVKKSVVKV